MKSATALCNRLLEEAGLMFRIDIAAVMIVTISKAKTTTEKFRLVLYACKRLCTSVEIIRAKETPFRYKLCSVQRTCSQLELIQCITVLRLKLICL